MQRLLVLAHNNLHCRTIDLLHLVGKTDIRELELLAFLTLYGKVAVDVGNDTALLAYYLH